MGMMRKVTELGGGQWKWKICKSHPIPCPPPKKEIKKEKWIGDKVCRTKDESKFLKLEKDKNEQTVSSMLNLNCLGDVC